MASVATQLRFCINESIRSDEDGAVQAGAARGEPELVHDEHK